jgi:alpha-1,3-fucosyltransferase
MKISEPDKKRDIPKVILYWNKVFNDSDMRFGFGQEPFINAGCKISNCIATNNRSLFNQSVAVIIHAGNYEERDLPHYRFSYQRFIFLNHETLPGMSYLPCFSRPHFYNWTMSHRRDSDVYVGKPYGALRQRKNSPVINNLPVKLKTGERPAKPEDLLTRKYPKLANRTKLIAWFNSHCSTHSQREDYVKQLAELVPVDIYGKCGHLKCLPWMDPRCDVLLEKYKFYLALENSLCPDYVTEKFYRALANNVIPIVYGGADYNQYAPPHSYVNIADFKSPKELAEYLWLLDKNDALYSKYFDWKKNYEVVRKPLDGWCDLCEKLNDPHEPSKSYDNLAKWWYDDVPCMPGSAYLKPKLR